jgi:hypothetical protein
MGEQRPYLVQATLTGAFAYLTRAIANFSGRAADYFRAWVELGALEQSVPCEEQNPFGRDRAWSRRVPPAPRRQEARDVRSGRLSMTGVLGVGMSVAASAYGTYAALAWCRYGRPLQPRKEERDPLLDRFMPAYEIVERHHTRVSAPAAVTLAAAREQELLRIPLVRAIFRAREIALGAVPDSRPQPRGLLNSMQALGWRVLAERPDRELVVGAVTRPWEPSVTFHPIPPNDFAAFGEPGFVKIAWTLRADPIDAVSSIFRTETRAIATDPAACARFRRYWAFAAPGIALIRRLSLQPLKAEAERRASGLPVTISSS